MASHLDDYVSNLISTRDIIYGASQLADDAGDALDTLDDAVDDIQKIANNIEALESIAENLNGVLRVIELFPAPVRQIADKVRDIVVTIEQRIEDLRERADEVEDVLKNFERGIDAMSLAVSALELDMANDITDIDAVIESVVDAQRALNAARLDAPGEVAAIEADLDALLSDLNSRFPQAKVDAMLAAAQQMSDTLSSYSGLVDIIADVGRGVADVLDKLDFLSGPLDTLAKAVSPLTWVLEKSGDVIDAVLGPVVDPILDALGVNDLVQSIADRVVTLMPGVDLFSPIDNLEVDLEAAIGQVQPDESWSLPLFNALQEDYDLLVADLLGENGYIAPLYGPYTSGTDFAAGRLGIFNDDDTLDALAGRDLLTGGSGDDTLTGGSDDDYIIGGSGDDSVDGGAGVDVFHVDGDIGQYGFTFDEATAVFTLTHVTTESDDFEGTDRLRDVEWISFGGGYYSVGVLSTAIKVAYPDNSATGTGADELLIGGSQADTISGGGGNDRIVGLWSYDSPGKDTIDGGSGIDTVQYYGANPSALGAFVLLDLSRTGLLGSRSDLIVNVENVVGSDYGDTLIGDGNNNGLAGRSGNDLIAGGAGGDRIDDGAGVDTLIGGDGDDVVVFKALEGQRDYAFAGRGQDRISGADTQDVIAYGTGGSDLLGAALTQAAQSAGFFATDLVFDMPDTISVQADPGGYTVTKSTAGASEVDLIDRIGILIGSAGGDTFALKNETVVIDGAGGDDLFVGYTPDLADQTPQSTSLLYGGDGNDTLVSLSADENFVGGAGDDTFELRVTLGNDHPRGEGNPVRVFYGGHAPAPDLDAATDDVRAPYGFDIFDMQGIDAGYDTLDLSGTDHYWQSVLETGRNVATSRVLSDDGDELFDVIYFSDVDRLITGSGGSRTRVAPEIALDFEGGAGRDQYLVTPVQWTIAADIDRSISGGAGDDVLWSGAGVDSVDGGEGRDVFYDPGNFDGAAEVFDGGAGDDLFILGRETWLGGSVTVLGGAGRDTLFLSTFANETGIRSVDLTAGTYFVDLTSKADVAGIFTSVENVLGATNVVGTQGANLIQGTNVIAGGGNDIIEARGVFDIDAGAGSDLVVAGTNGHADGGDGVDQLWFQGQLERNVLDYTGIWLSSIPYDRREGVVLFLDQGRAEVAGTEVTFANFERFGGSNGDDQMLAGTIEDVSFDGFAGDDLILGGSGQDTLSGGRGADTVDGGAGDDTILLGPGTDDYDLRDRGTDIVRGGTGFDTLYLWNNATGVAIDADGTITGRIDYRKTGGEAWPFDFSEELDIAELRASIESIERLVLGSGADRLIGNDIMESVDAGAGDDTISGGAGAETLRGGAGDDVIRGGYDDSAIGPDMIALNIATRDDYLIATDIALPGKGWSIEITFKGVPGASAALFSYGVPGQTNEIMIFTDQIAIKGVAATYAANTSNAMLDGMTHTLIASFAEDGRTKVMLDGVQVLDFFPDLSTLASDDIESGGTVVIAQDQDGTVPGDPATFDDGQAFEGGIADVRIYDMAFGPREAFLSGGLDLTQTGLADRVLHHWSVDGKTGQMVSRAGAEIRTEGTAIFDKAPAAQPVAPAQPDLAVLGAGGRLEDWLRVDNLQMPSTALTVEIDVADLDPDPNGCIFSYGVDGQTNAVSLFASTIGINNEFFTHGVDFSAAGRHLISFTWTTSGDVRIYVDGKLEFAGDYALGGTGTVGSGGVLIIGQDQDGVTAGNPASYQDSQALDGKIGDIRIYDRVLTEAEIWRNATNDTRDAGVEVDIVAHWSVDAASQSIVSLKGTAEMTATAQVGWQAAPPTAERPEDGDDFLFGDAGHDIIWGDLGADIIDGGADNDTIIGGAGGDSIIGGAGDDLLIADDVDPDLLAELGLSDAFLFA